MHTHVESSGTTDGAGDGAEVGSVVGASLAIADRVDGHASAASHGNGCRRLNSLSSAGCVRHLVQVLLGSLLVNRISAGDDLAVVDVVVGGAAVIARGDGRVGAGRVLANLRLILRDVQAGGIGDVEGIELILQAHLLRKVDALADGEIEALLPGLTEDVALSLIEGRFVDVLRKVCT